MRHTALGLPSWKKGGLEAGVRRISRFHIGTLALGVSTPRSKLFFPSSCPSRLVFHRRPSPRFLKSSSISFLPSCARVRALVVLFPRTALVPGSAQYFRPDQRKVEGVNQPRGIEVGDGPCERRDIRVVWWLLGHAEGIGERTTGFSTVRPIGPPHSRPLGAYLASVAVARVSSSGG